jgi:bifunctional non-homologous end joining protein LigD
VSESVVVTHPEKVMFPDDGITKGDLVDYYDFVGPVMLPHIERRPITMERFNRGVGTAGFFQKNVSRGFPAWLERVEVPKKGGTVNHPLVTEARSLRWLANQNCVTMHVWPSRAPRLERPDVCVFDLDPATATETRKHGGARRSRGADRDLEVLIDAALGLRDLLGELGLACWIKTTGSKGFHIVVPLDESADWSEASEFAHHVGAELVRRDPEHLTQEFSKVDRGGRIYVDTGRNGYSATFAAPYTVRAKPGAPVSAPCTWEEIARGKVTPHSFTLKTMRKRIQAVGDLWKELLTSGQSLAGAIERLRDSAAG